MITTMSITYVKNAEKNLNYNQMKKYNFVTGTREEIILKFNDHQDWNLISVASSGSINQFTAFYYEDVNNESV